MFEYLEEEKRIFIGCFWCYENGRLSKISLGVPFMDNDITVLINIHEYVHGIMSYRKLGKKWKPGIDIEILPILYEKIYILENPSEQLVAYGKMLDRMIDEDADMKYKLALKYRDELIQLYDNGMSFDKLDRNAKRLVRKGNLQKKS